ncbi:MAG: hypothetical protein H9W83_02760 [Leuconostoc sp.]|nr:hypothetical protein [Leuconostoc sp.]
MTFLDDPAQTWKAFGIIGITDAFYEQNNDAGEAGPADPVVLGDRTSMIRSDIDNMHSGFLCLKAGDLTYVSFQGTARILLYLEGNTPDRPWIFDTDLTALDGFVLGMLKHYYADSEKRACEHRVDSASGLSDWKPEGSGKGYVAEILLLFG